MNQFKDNAKDYTLSEQTMKTSFLLIGAALLTFGAGAQAQNRGNRNNNRGNNNRGAQNGATFPLPEGVESVVSIDAYNILVAQTNRNGQRDFSPIIVRHIYSGGLAKLFGGSSVPTEQFVTPGTLGRNSNNNGGNNNGGGFQNGAQNGGTQNFGAFQMRRRATALQRRN